MKRFSLIFVVMIMLMSSTALAADAKYILNSAPLIPTWTNVKPCDDIIRETLSQITNNSMSTYDKVKSCYDYLINTCSYGSTPITRQESVRRYVNGVLVSQSGDPYYNIRDFGVSRAYDMLKGHVGVCDDYSCAFAALVRAIGLNCYTIGGLTAKASGGMTGHIWTVININGTEYVFDPQIDDNIAKGGKIGYYRFCKTYAEVAESYADYKIYSSYFKPFD